MQDEGRKERVQQTLAILRILDFFLRPVGAVEEFQQGTQSRWAGKDGAKCCVEDKADGASVVTGNQPTWTSRAFLRWRDRPGSGSPRTQPRASGAA